MARENLTVWIRLERVHCHEEGDFIGAAEPYLWPIFFKIDGSTVVLSDSLKLSGTATVEGSYGHHGNLGDGGVGVGDDLAISHAIGSWQTVLKPIPIPASLEDSRDREGGIAGVVVVLMEEDNVSDAGALAGYGALVNAVQAGLDSLIPTLGFGHETATPEEIEALGAAARTAAENAVRSQQGFFADIWAGIDRDDEIGSAVLQFGHDLLAGGEVQNIQPRWHNHGDWELFGHANASKACPAESVAQLDRPLGLIFGGGEMQALRAFRDRTLPANRGAREWWGLAERNAAALTWLFQTDREAARALSGLGPAAARALADPGAAIPDELVAQARTILERACRAPSRTLRRDARLALGLLETTSGRTVAQMVAVSDVVRPSRGFDRTTPRAPDKKRSAKDRPAY